MKKVTIPTEQEIDWSKPQWLQHNVYETLIVLTTGEHGEDIFSGTTLPCDGYEEGEFSNYWLKREFHLLTTDIPFTISNKD